ncbi:winged helix-turn-helix transcriptional regulator [Actinacidiphila glaucinigra]|uniref:winged helix-turn-helix transcriptional regulator n=1 Tax=Actinacidiphila glaucinigra TaxID=235986 RepID=UPI0036E2F68C
MSRTSPLRSCRCGEVPVRSGGGRLAVQRGVWATVPPQVGYALTERGRSLLHVVRDLAGWADAHAQEISRARVEYDATRD